MTETAPCFLCLKDGKACDKGRPCGNCRARGTPQMCVGTELASRLGSPHGTTSSNTARVKQLKSQGVATPKPPLKQITGPEHISVETSPVAHLPADGTRSRSKDVRHTHNSSNARNTPHSGAYGDESSDLLTQASHAPYTPYINDDLSNHMNGISLMYPEGVSGMVVDDTNYMPPASPPPETYMQLEPKRPRKKRDRYPEPEGPSSAYQHTTQWSEHDLAPARIQHGGASSLEMMKEIAHLKAELENAKLQNDVLNKRMMMMAETAQAFTQLQQYMQHLKLLPDSMQGQTKDLVVGNPRALSAADLKKLEPYGAFRDACVRYHGTPIVLFDLSQPTPLVTLANDSFNDLFSTEAAQKPWVTFIAPPYLERTKHILNDASQRAKEAVKFVQVYKDALQNTFVAIDIHRFFVVQSPHSNRIMLMDLVFILRNPQMNYPRSDDYTYWQIPVNEFGPIDLQAPNAPFNFPSTAHQAKLIANSLTASTGITVPPSGLDTDPDSPIRAPHHRIDILSSPDITEVTTPPQDGFNLSPFPQADKTISASPLETPGWLDMMEGSTWGAHNPWHGDWDASHSSTAPNNIVELSSPTSPSPSTLGLPHSHHLSNPTAPIPFNLFSSISDLSPLMQTSSDGIPPPPFGSLDGSGHL